MNTDGSRYRIRAGQPGDVAELAAINAAVHLQAQTGGKPHPGIAAWTRDLFAGHPTVTPADFLVAEDVVTGRPVASLVAVTQQWRHGPVQLPVVQVELVGTDPAHRGQRLTDRLFEALHERCDRESVALQLIEGIPYFYRRFGYEYALASGGAPFVPAAALPGAPTAAALRARPGTPADADALAAVDAALADQDGLHCPRDAAMWRYELGDRDPENFVRRGVIALVDPDDTVVGYTVHAVRPSAAGELAVFAAGCARPADWAVAAPVLLAQLGVVGRQTAEVAGRPFSGVRPLLDAAHPLSRFAPAGVPHRPGAWYVRTGDPVALLRRWAPALARRWRTAALRWPDRTLRVDTYGHGMQLEFRDGELSAVAAAPRTVAPADDPAVHAVLPVDALLQLVLGHRTLAEVLHAWPDAVIRDRTTELFLAAAFPRTPPMVWPIL
ncbi:Acetyltransferase (GNAT) domain-containing protein [Micromonospora pattaloongensis]|uniref:Acetyltransferase (GNAT) domain-containing protein n=1 Tax=Micromonospora pattaloongensis TaxID=405436 RepID=A0A1H3P9D4_9ACTN|nr:GNAT family N-acetyltransferase [Micromonospora pattaloongensis]SDY97774.1 Acetyltransferase (GNAT) domain-containing protein [Micromonospora pattaloongensis]